MNEELKYNKAQAIFKSAAPEAQAISGSTIASDCSSATFYKEGSYPFLKATLDFDAKSSMESVKQEVAKLRNHLADELGLTDVEYVTVSAFDENASVTGVDVHTI
ncbi:MAG: hypothetical protein LBT80_00535 [Lactobacillaceae bacterium]|jgi:ribulose kinase|nr:hypothetical protein [Lactobacillaceae bacterium]